MFKEITFWDLFQNSAQIPDFVTPVCQGKQTKLHSRDMNLKDSFIVKQLKTKSDITTSRLQFVDFT